MGFQSKHSGSFTSLLAGLVLLFTAAGIVISFMPIIKCPESNCALELCPVCRGHQRVTLLKRWMWKPTPWVAIGTFDNRQVKQIEILSALFNAEIESEIGVYELKVPAGKTKAAIEVLQKSKLPGLHLYDAGLKMK